MAEERVQRRLDAILGADVVGYSRLMRADEIRTLNEPRKLRQEIFDPKISDHNGRVVKLMGDGQLVEFASAVDAVSCAIDRKQRVLPFKNLSDFEIRAKGLQKSGMA